jgi:riboflavin kinase/FMN adenylyltransferase
VRSVQIVTDMSQAAWEGERAVITIGTYDGIHLGHRAVINQVRQHAQRLGAKSVVVTFDRHPASVVRPESAPKLLTDRC